MMSYAKRTLLSIFAVIGLEVALVGAGNDLQSTVGTYNCVATAGGRVIDRFQSVNAAWGPWLRAVATDTTTGQAPDVDYIYVGFDGAAKRWNIIGVDSSGTYWTRHSISASYNGSQWVDDHPQDGGRAVVHVLGSGSQYTFDLTTPKSGGGKESSHTVCTRR